MSDSYREVTGELGRMVDRLRTLRDSYCEPKNNQNPRYHALSSAISQINKAAADMQREGQA